jgi:hypothetical protein
MNLQLRATSSTTATPVPFPRPLQKMAKGGVWGRECPFLHTVYVSGYEHRVAPAPKLASTTGPSGRWDFASNPLWLMGANILRGQ